MLTHTINVTSTIDAASKSTGGNEDADAGKLLVFNTEGQIQGSSDSSSLAAVKGTASGSGYGVHGDSSSGTGVVGQSVNGNGVDAASNNKIALSAINLHTTEPVIVVKNANVANTAPLAIFRRNNNQGMTVANDGGLSWDTATGAASTRTGLGLGTAAQQNTGAFDAAGSAAAAQAAAIAASQPLDSDLTSYANAADAAARRALIGLGTASVANTGTGASDVPTITNADARYALIALPQLLTYTGGNQINATTTPANIHASASWVIATAGLYMFAVRFSYDVANTSVGARFMVNSSDIVFDFLSYDSDYTTGSSSRSSSTSGGFNAGAAVPTSLLTSGNGASLNGIINITTPGTLSLSFAASLATANALTVTNVTGLLRKMN